MNFLLFQIINAIVAICVFVPADIFKYWIPPSSSKWAQFVSLTGLLWTALLLIFYLFHIIEKLSKIPWIVIEMGLCFAWAFFHMSVGLDLIVKGTEHNYYKTDEFLTYGTSFFCFCGVLIYGIDGGLKFKGWRESRLGLAQRDVRTI